MSVVWLTSYPKSGDTFARMLLHNYLYGETQDTEIVAERIPGLHYLLAKKIELKVKNDEKKVVKSHFCFSHQHPYFNITSGFIYIIRNPRDVLLSNARYLGATSSPDELRRFAKNFIENMGEPRWQQANMGTWPEHVASWLYYTTSVPHIFIKYEEMRSDPFNVLKRLISFMGIETDESRIQMAVDSCEIEKVRKHELVEKELGRTKVYNQLPNDESFIGEGKIGQSLTSIGEDIELLYKKRFGNFINLFNYE